MVVLLTAKNEEYPVKSFDDNKFHFFKRSRATNSPISNVILLNFELI